jgi:hypothetical protein
MGPDRAAYLLSKQTSAPQALAMALKVAELRITQRGKKNRRPPKLHKHRSLQASLMSSQ